MSMNTYVLGWEGLFGCPEKGVPKAASVSISTIEAKTGL